MPAPDALIKYLLPLRRVGRLALITPPSEFLVVGDALLVMGDVPLNVRRSRLIHLSMATDLKEDLKQWQVFREKAQRLGSRSLANFCLSADLLEKLRLVAGKIDSTHIRLFSHPNRGIVARLFDVRIGSHLSLPKIKRIYSAATFNVSKVDHKEFSLTLSVETLRLLPKDDLLMSVYADGILEVVPVNGKLNEHFMCRDQDIVEPYTSFMHERLGRPVYFVSHPTL